MQKKEPIELLKVQAKLNPTLQLACCAGENFSACLLNGFDALRGTWLDCRLATEWYLCGHGTLTACAWSSRRGKYVARGVLAF